MKKACGGVVINLSGQVLLREPAGHYKGDSSDIRVTYYKPGGSGSSNRFCPHIQGEWENRDGGNGPRAIRSRGIYRLSEASEVGFRWFSLPDLGRLSRHTDTTPRALRVEYPGAI